MAVMLGSQTYSELVYALVADTFWSWTEPFWMLDRGNLLAEIGLERKPVGNYDKQLTSRQLNRLGCTGCWNGAIHWLCWDLDVGHGKEPYASVKDAVAAGLKLRSAVGWGELRRSSRGRGVTLRTILPDDLDLPAEIAGAMAREAARLAGVSVDDSAAGRQASWLWSARPENDAFALLEDHGKVEFELP